MDRASPSQQDPWSLRAVNGILQFTAGWSFELLIWDITHLVKCSPYLQYSPCLIPPRCGGSSLQFSHLGGRDMKIPGARWSGNLAEPVSSLLCGRLCFSKQEVERDVNVACLVPAHTCVNIRMHISAYILVGKTLMSPFNKYNCG